MDRMVTKIKLYQPILVYPGIEYKAYGFNNDDKPYLGIVTNINEKHKFFMVKCLFGGIILTICYKLGTTDELYNTNIYDICNYIMNNKNTIVEAYRGS